MELFKGIDIAIIWGMSFFVIGIIQWVKTDIANVWIVRAISLVVSFGFVGMYWLLTPINWQLFIVYGVCVFLSANGIWHTADTIGRSTLGK